MSMNTQNPVRSSNREIKTYLLIESLEKYDRENITKQT